MAQFFSVLPFFFFLSLILFGRLSAFSFTDTDFCFAAINARYTKSTFGSFRNRSTVRKGSPHRQAPIESSINGIENEASEALMDERDLREIPDQENDKWRSVRVADTDGEGQVYEEASWNEPEKQSESAIPKHLGTERSFNGLGSAFGFDSGDRDVRFERKREKALIRKLEKSRLDGAKRQMEKAFEGSFKSDVGGMMRKQMQSLASPLPGLKAMLQTVASTAEARKRGKTAKR